MALSVKNFGGGGSIGAVENLLSPKLATSTKNGVTCTNNGDGTYTFNGTASAKSSFYMGYDFPVTVGQKILGCPKGGSADTYRFCVNGLGYEYGDGLIVETTRMTYAWIEIQSGYTCDNLIFKPMLTTNLKATYKEFVKRVGGFNNLFVPTAPTQTIDGITFTNNGDGTYTLNGTTGSSSVALIVGKVSMEDGKQYKLTGCPKGGKIGSAFYYEIQYGYPVNGFDYGEGAICQGSSSADTRVWISIKPNTTLNNVVFKPMLTESLLPEYFDFVKGVADGITPQMFGCTKMWSNTIVNTSNRRLRDVGNFNHGLGVVPKVYAILIDDDSASSASYMSICQLIGFYTDSTYHAHIHSSRYPNGFTGERTYSSTDSSVSATSISFTGTSSSYAGGQYLLAGHTYKFIVMA